jgi:cell division control protein 6
MGVFDNILHSDESLFKNPEALDFEYVPKIIPYRENEQRRIAAAIQPLFADRTGKNIVIHGLPGIGKTVACRHVLKELEEKTEDIIAVYVNCWKKNTSYKIVLDICEQIGYRFTQNKKSDEIFKEVIKILNKKKVVFVFDEIDKAEDYDFLYLLIEEIYKKSIILITNFKDTLESIDERVKSRLIPELIEFKVYNADETKGILKQRLEFAFNQGVWETDAFEAVVKKAFSLRDIRSGIQLLKDSGDVAESKASRKITLEHAKKAIGKIDEFGTIKSTDLGSDDKTILELVKNNPKSKIGDLFKLYSEVGKDISYKTFQRKLKAMEKKDFVKLMKSQGDGGNTTIVEYKERTAKLSEF